MLTVYTHSSLSTASQCSNVQPRCAIHPTKRKQQPPAANFLLVVGVASHAAASAADAEHLAMLGAAVRTRADGLGFRVEGYLAFHARHVSGIAILAGPCLSFFPAASANHMRFSIL